MKKLPLRDPEAAFQRAATAQRRHAVPAVKPGRWH